MDKIKDIFRTEIYGTARYKNMHTSIMSFPIIIDVEPTNGCNLDCLFCARQIMKRPVSILPFTSLKIIIDEMKHNPPTSIRFSGWGEPTLHPEIVRFVSYSRKNNVLTHLTTNGTRMTSELAEQLLRADLNKIKFSLQGLTPAEYNRMRRSRNTNDREHHYEKIKENILNFINARNRLQSPCHIQISVSMLKNEQDDPDLQQQFYDEWYPQVDSIWGLGKVGIYGGKPLLTSFQRAKQSGRISEEDIAEGRPLREKDVNRGKKCTELYNKISISADGLMKACCDDFDNQLVIGQVGSETIGDVWKGEKLQLLRENIESGILNRVPRFCRDCDNYL